MPHLHRISLVPVIPLRFERRTHALEGRCSIQLSYGTIPVICKAFSDSAAIRTQDPRLRRALLYPAELRNHPKFITRFFDNRLYSPNLYYL